MSVAQAKFHSINGSTSEKQFVGLKSAAMQRSLCLSYMNEEWEDEDEEDE